MYREPKKRKPKPWTLKTLKKKLDIIFSLYIRQRDKKCVICWRRENLNCWHYLSRIANWTRRDEINCNTQCATCNRLHEYNPEPYRRFMIEHYGKKKLVEQLLLKEAQKFKETPIEIKIKTIKEYWEEILEELHKKWSSATKFTLEELNGKILHYKKFVNDKVWMQEDIDWYAKEIYVSSEQIPSFPSKGTGMEWD